MALGEHMDAMFRGSGVAIVTPFREGNIDWDAFARLIEFQIDNGTDCIVALGTTGESATLTHEEKTAVARFVISEVSGRVPVMVGAGSNSTAVAVESSKEMQDLGADSLLHVTPYYNKATQGGLLAHYTTIADAVEIPIVTYNVPSRTSTNLLPATLAELSEHPRIGGHKEASGDLPQIMELFRLCRGKLAIWSGNDDHVYPMLALGGHGVISVAAHIIPQQMHDMVQLFLEGKMVEARAIQEAANPLIGHLFAEVNPIPVKAALSMMGLCEDELRLPLTPMTQDSRSVLRRAMTQYGLI